MYIIIHQPAGPLSIKNEDEMQQFLNGKMIIEAAGGMVFNEFGELLMIKRRGYWDMPKGKIDEGESIEECALREVSEETGLQELKIVQKLQVTYHTYIYKGVSALKPSHWFKMIHSGLEILVPQTEEDITEIRWVKKDEAIQLYDSMFPSIQEMVNKFYIM